MPNPNDAHTLRSFIRICNYYKIYGQDFSIITHPFYALLKKDVAWTRSEEVQEAFNTFKEKLLEFPILRRPDFSKVFIVHIDWSAFGIGVILGQLDEKGMEYVIAYASQSNNKAESNYSSCEGECFVVVWAVIHFKPYLYGTKFTLHIDHWLIKWLMTNNKVTSKLARWVFIFQEHEFKVIHRLVLHIRMRIPCRGNLSLPLKIFQKLGKTSTRFQQYMYFIHLVILHYCNVTWLNIPLWIYGRTWTP
jgi:hypothetical protein